MGFLFIFYIYIYIEKKGEREKEFRSISNLKRLKSQKLNQSKLYDIEIYIFLK